MARADSFTGVPVEILVEENQIVPIGIRLKFRDALINRTLTVLVPQEDLRETVGELRRYLPQGEHLAGARGKFDFEIVSQIVMEFLQRFDQQVVHGKPDRTAPVGISAK